MRRWGAPAGRRALALAVIGIAAATPAEGAAWRRIAPLPAAAVNALAADQTGRRIAAAAGGKIYLSQDGGRSWRGSGDADGEVQGLAFLEEGPHGAVLVAVGENGVRESQAGRAWQPADVTGVAGRGAVRAVIQGPPGKAGLALGTDGGVILAERLEEGWGPVVVALQGRPVHRLAWTQTGALVAASEEGLYRIDPSQPGAARRLTTHVARDLASSGNRVAAATDRGTLVATGEGARWREVEGGGVMSRSTDAVAALPDEPGAFLAVDSRRVWRIAPGGPPLAVADPPPGESTLALLPLRGRLLAATDRGLYETTLPSAPGSSPHAHRLLPEGGLAAADVRDPWSDDPPLDLVRRAVLRASHLEPGRIRRNFWGVRYRALLPEFSISLRRRLVRHSDQERDQTFTSGALHHLFDTSRDQDLDRDLVLAAEWDLGSLLFEPDELDVSEEARRVLALRDDVLDEVNQLYFDRRRALLSLAGLADNTGPEALHEVQMLQIQIDELTARLDAWTDGYFSRERSRRIHYHQQGSPRVTLSHQEEP
jgi:hypothetical protein